MLNVMKAFLKNQFLKLVGFIVLCTILVGVGYWTGTKIAQAWLPSSILSHENQILTIKNIAQVSTYQVAKVVTYEWSNEAKANAHYHRMMNALFGKRLTLNIPLVATYGIDISDKRFQIETHGDTLFVFFPPPKLLQFEWQWEQKKAFSEKGLLVLNDNLQFEQLEKTAYQKYHLAFEKDRTNLNQAKQVFQEKIKNFYEPFFKVIRLQEQP